MSNRQARTLNGETGSGMVPLAELQAERRRKQEARRQIVRIKSTLESYGLTVDTDGNITRFVGGNGHGE